MFLFVGLVEVVACRHSPWNPNNLISSDPKQASKPYMLVSSKQHRCTVGQDVAYNPSKSQTPRIQQVICLFVAICYTRHQIDQKDSDTLWYDLVQTTK